MMDEQRRQRERREHERRARKQREDYFKRANEDSRRIQLRRRNRVKMPVVVNLTAEQAARRLAEAGLVAEVVTVASSEAAGTVIAQDPASGGKVQKGSAVPIKVSSGLAHTPSDEVHRDRWS